MTNLPDPDGGSAPRIVYHIGVAGRLGNKLNTAFTRNLSILAGRGIHAPSRRVYRPLLRDLVWDEHFTPDAQRETRATISGDSVYDVMVLSNDQALAAKEYLFADGEFLNWSEKRISRFSELYADHAITYVIETENFATLIPRMVQYFDPEQLAYIQESPIGHHSWYDLVAGLSLASPGAAFVIVPGEIVAGRLRAIKSLFFEPRRPNFLINRLGSAVSVVTHPILGKPADVEATDLEPIGWYQEHVSRLSDVYLDDLERLCGLPHVSVVV
ncbi:hypothetical protein [Litoreibacter roseus]|uniref:Sulfotransferase family protein n=1 Tax=Litoreibacter roseus TaxID=2601869 RepID=A0A6N6JDN2_9RHOB|nr:hypothetical protein [Litoreibacter roseus]GFE63940.1 hypothetical protein KIN_10140 [Litoreibacter roseus]